VDASRLFLLGFSMGTVMALSVALTMPELFRGVSANSGYLVEEPPRPYSWREAERLNVFLTHGTADPIIPLQMARRARQILMEAGVTLLYREYPAGHEISQQTIVDVADWMEKLM
jgi:phospholipase/carboxylesterase